MPTEEELAKMTKQARYYWRHGKANRVKQVKQKQGKANALPVVEGKAAPHWVNNKLIRLHALGKLYEYTAPLTLAAIETKLDKAGYIANETYHWTKLQNTIYYRIQYKGFEVRLTTLSITIWAKEDHEQRGIDASRMMHDRALGMILPLFKELEGLLSLELNYLSGRIVEEHLAHMNDEGAQEMDRLKHKTKILDDADGHVRAQIDHSKDVPEVEFQHKDHAQPDSSRYDQMLSEVIKQNAWNVLFESLVELKERVAEHKEELKKLREARL